MSQFFAPRCAWAKKPVAFACALLCAFPVAAQSNVQEPVIITATRNAQLSSDVLSDHIVITAEEIRASGHASLAELLQKKRGFELSSNGGPTNYTSVFMRGTANAQSIVLVDGIRIGSATNGGATWAAIPLAQIERVEIVYGPLSSLYGADAMGGVVQIFTKPGTTFLEPNVAIGFGTRDAQKIELGLSGSSGGERPVKFSLNAVHDEEHGHSASKPQAGRFTYNSDKDGYSRDSFSGQLSHVLAKGHEIGTTLLRSRQNTQFDAGPTYDDREVASLEAWGIYSKNQWMLNWHSQLRMAIGNDRATSDASYGLSRYDTKQTQFSWQNDITIGQDVLQLMLEHRKEEVGSSENDLQRDRTTRSAVAAYQLKRDQHLATFSARNDRISGGESVNTGSLAYGYRFSKQWRATASIGTSFRAPTFNELYYPGFGLSSNKPERGRNAEFGLVYDGGTSHLNLALFRNRITDLLVYAPTCPVEQDTHPWGCSYNLNKTQITGLSIGGDARLSQSFVLRASLDWQDAKDSTTGKFLPRRARTHGSVNLDYSAGPFSATVETVFSGKRYDDVANTNQLKSYALMNLHGSYMLNKRWRLQARWNNVFNKDYELARNYQSPKSHLFVGLRYEN